MDDRIIHKAMAAAPMAVEADLARDLELINARFALVPLAPEEVELRRMRLANDQVDRTHERFSPAFLERLAATIVGKSVLAHHDKTAFPIGRFYAAEVAGPSPHWLVARYYMLRTPGTEEVRRQIDAGVYSYVSIGFRGGEARCDLCGQPFAGDCPHWPGRTYETPAGARLCTLTWEDPRGDAEAVEGSLVWLGAQIGAQHVKGCEKIEPRRHEGHEEGTKGVESLVFSRLSSCTSSCSSCLRGSNPRKEHPLESDQPTIDERLKQLEPLARDGEAYRADLMAEIGRLAGLVGAAKEAAFLCETLAPLGADRLKELKAEYERRVEEKFPPRGYGQPTPDAPPAPTRDPRAHTLI